MLQQQMNEPLLVGTFFWGQNESIFHCQIPGFTSKRVLFPICSITFQDKVTLPWLEYRIENLADLTVELARNELNCNFDSKCS
jgi:hypothetical protein